MRRACTSRKSCAAALSRSSRWSRSANAPRSPTSTPPTARCARGISCASTSAASGVRIARTSRAPRVLGTPSDKQARYYAAILAGERAAIAAMKPGVPVNRLFAVAVRVTRENGLPHYQRHHIGHGIGLEPYDPPTINATTTTALEAGMVFCVETPYYEHGWGGVQVEDAVEVTPTGARALTRSSQELAVVG